MKRFADLSYRIKIPLAITTVIVMTELVVSAALVTRAFSDAGRDLEASANNLGAVLARSLRDPIIRDDVWQAFEVIRTPLAARLPDNPLHGIVVLDADSKVLVSTDPQRVPVMSEATALPAALRALLESDDALRSAASYFSRERIDDELGALAPVLSEDGNRIGSVLLLFDAQRYSDRIWNSIADIALVSIPGMLLLIPLGWIAGKRMAEPLSRLAQTLTRVGTQPAESLANSLPPASGDEIGTLARSAHTMLEGMARKEALEREVVTAERLAAVGRVSAAIAHEINNPLGGMLNAIDTLDKHGQPDAFTRKTLALLERGLQQIRGTVGALLVEARLDSPALAPSDWQDLKMLIAPQAATRGVQLNWKVDCDETLPLPAHQVRQLALNLLLNATEAAEPGGVIELSVALRGSELVVSVGNSGNPIPANLMERLFEPFVTSAQAPTTPRSYGLGLWICYQIMNQLNGTITAESEDGWTRFIVTLPVRTARLSTSPETHAAPLLD